MLKVNIHIHIRAILDQREDTHQLSYLFSKHSAQHFLRWGEKSSRLRSPFRPIQWCATSKVGKMGRHLLYYGFTQRLYWISYSLMPIGLQGPSGGGWLCFLRISWWKLAKPLALTALCVYKSTLTCVGGVQILLISYIFHITPKNCVRFMFIFGYLRTHNKSNKHINSLFIESYLVQPISQ